jgi:hypothetical protein
VAGWAASPAEGKVLATGNTPSQEQTREVVAAMDGMASEAAVNEDRMSRWRNRRSRPDAPAKGGGAVYGIGMIGAMAYFFQSAESGWDYVLAIPRASVWPALLVYKLLKSFYG